MVSTDLSPSVHATGQPDTPIEVLEDILSQASKEKDVEQLRHLVQRAHKLVSGLDPYLEHISTPPSDVSLPLQSTLAKHDKNLGKHLCKRSN
jgi:hypothetical protein